MDFIRACLGLFGGTLAAVWRVEMLRFFLAFLVFLAGFYLTMAIIHSTKKGF